MRALPARRIATSVLCASLLLGAAGPVIAAENDSPHGSAQAAARAPVPGADALLAQIKTLGDVGGVLTPVTALLDAVLKADNGQLPAAEATKHADAVKAAITAATAAAAPKAPALPKTPAVPEAPAVPAVPKAMSSDDKAAADLKGDALKALQSAVDALLKAAAGGDVGAVVTAVPIVLTSLVNLIAATLLGGGLPVPNLPGLPALPKLPTDALPVPLPL
ncbi:hypothetical protein OG453_23720 [Streptomyces sp. NBC_01381]|uniref:hypothetical protein n=1 Tax=Streptomyces sp. NBC_01381 TaxID=2903845 RepID=UPI00225B95E0|nr:hypothetical protein [Streptomyces sp. NBC_01381]MCX4669654.1 hypothetical protein [Streptomyces sp. NBC_01381]